jgi:glutamate transport system permease protein
VNVITDNLDFLLMGVVVTLTMSLLGFLGALVLGVAAAVARISPVPPLRAAGAVYVEVFRSIPLLSLLVLVVFGLPDVGVTLGLYTSAVVCLALVGGAFVCETMRAGINAVSVGQAEAVRALGLTFGQSLRHVILPQALLSMIQPLTNIFIGTLLSSSLAAAVGVNELTNRTQQLNLQYAEAIACFLFAGLVYLAVALASGSVAGRLDRRMNVVR